MAPPKIGSSAQARGGACTATSSAGQGTASAEAKRRPAQVLTSQFKLSCAISSQQRVPSVTIVAVVHTHASGLLLPAAHAGRPWGAVLQVLEDLGLALLEATSAAQRALPEVWEVGTVGLPQGRSVPTRCAKAGTVASHVHIPSTRAVIMGPRVRRPAQAS